MPHRHGDPYGSTGLFYLMPLLLFDAAGYAGLKIPINNQQSAVNI